MSHQGVKCFPNLQYTSITMMNVGKIFAADSSSILHLSTLFRTVRSTPYCTKHSKQDSTRGGVCNLGTSAASPIAVLSQARLEIFPNNQPTSIQPCCHLPFRKRSVRHVAPYLESHSSWLTAYRSRHSSKPQVFSRKPCRQTNDTRDLGKQAAR